VSLLGIFFSVELFFVASLTHLFAVIYINSLFLLNVFICLFISRQMHLYFLGNLWDILVQFLNCDVSVEINRAPSSSLKKKSSFSIFL